MDNKTLGIILILASLSLMVMLGFIRANVVQAYQWEIDYYISRGEACPSDPDLCPHEQKSRAQMPIFIAGASLLGIMALGLYLVLFEKSQKEIISALKKEKQLQKDEEIFSILLKGLSLDEQKAIKAIKEQDGIEQNTLRLRTDLHKSKLSIILDSLEKKGLVKRVQKGRTKQVFMKIRI